MNADRANASPASTAGVSPPEVVAAHSVSLPGRILVVDDETAIREIVADVLGRSGHRVTCACDGKAGWDALCADPFDVLITDHDMPRLSGLDLLRRLRSAHLNLPVVFISGSISSDDPDLYRFLPPGVALEKPFSLKVLLRTIHNLLASIPHRSADRTGQSLMKLEQTCTPNGLHAGQSSHRSNLASSMVKPV